MGCNVGPLVEEEGPAAWGATHSLVPPWAAVPVSPGRHVVCHARQGRYGCTAVYKTAAHHGPGGRQHEVLRLVRLAQLVAATAAAAAVAAVAASSHRDLKPGGAQGR